jgi:multimeric flavodoxin WrbA
MKVFGITCGRKNGNSEMLLKEAFKGIEEKCGAETSFIRLQDANILPCTGCESCMKHHITGDWDFRCIHKKEADHFFFIETQLREADAVIISAPAYNLLPPGILITMLNKLHASGNYRQVVAEKPKIGAAITLGGTDWTNFAMTFTAMTVMELCGGFSQVVDHLEAQFVPAPGSILTDGELMARARTLGENVADALKNPGKIGFKGAEGVCPTCHGRFLEVRKEEVFCPMCDTKGDVSTEKGSLKVTFSEEAIGKNRWGEWGHQIHIQNIIKGHKKAMDNKEMIDVKRKEYADYKQPLNLPEIEAKGKGQV